MIEYICLTLGLFAVSTFVYFDGIYAIKYRYERFRNLNQLVSTKYKERINCNTKMKIVWFSIVIILKVLYLSILEKLNKSIKKIDNNTYELSYAVNGKIYKMIIIPNRGPSSVLQVIDDNNDDITDFILPYLGPKENWHGFRGFTPSFFKRKSLTFNMMSTEKTFYNDETMVLDI